MCFTALGCARIDVAAHQRRKRQEHSDLNAAIDTLTQSHVADRMLIQRLKKRKLALKDRIVELENILLPDIIA